MIGYMNISMCMNLLTSPSGSKNINMCVSMSKCVSMSVRVILQTSNMTKGVYSATNFCIIVMSTIASFISLVWFFFVFFDNSTIRITLTAAEATATLRFIFLAVQNLHYRQKKSNQNSKNVVHTEHVQYNAHFDGPTTIESGLRSA